MSNIAKPSVHLNGTSGRDLLEQYVTSMETLQKAIETLPTPHGRDYYIQPGGSTGAPIDKALAEHRERLETLHRIRREIEEIAMHINEQVQ